VATRNGGCDLGDVTDLAGEGTGHEVHVVREGFPRAADAGHGGLTAQVSFRARFASPAGHFARERVQLVHHRVDGVFQFENFALHVHRDFARKVAARDGGRNFGDVTNLTSEVAGHRVHRVRQVLPRAGDAGHHGLTAKTTVGA